MISSLNSLLNLGPHDHGKTQQSFLWLLFTPKRLEKSLEQSFSAVGTVDNLAWIINGEGPVLGTAAAMP